MNPSSLHELWHSPANRPEAEAAQQLARQFVTRLRRRRRFQAGWLACTCTLMTTATAAVVIYLIRNGLNAVSGQSAVIPMMILPWLVLGYFLRAFFRQTAVAKESGLPLHDAVRAARDSNAAERRHLGLVGGLYGAMALLSAVAVWQLHTAGKTPGQQVWSMTGFFAVIFVCGATGLILRYRRQLLPEQRMIEAQLRELEEISAR